MTRSHITSAVSEGRGQRTRRLLLDTAARLFAEHGYAGTSTSEILRAAELTKGSLYHFFPSKQALARAVIEDRQVRWRQLLAEVARQHPGAIEQLLVLSERVAELYRTDRAAVAVARLSAELRETDPTAPRPYTGWLTIVTELFTRAQHDGEVTDVLPAHTLAEVFVAAFVGAESLSGALADRADLPARVRDVWALLLPGLRLGPTKLTRSPAGLPVDQRTHQPHHD